MTLFDLENLHKNILSAWAQLRATKRLVRKWISVFLCKSVQSLGINAKMEEIILLGG